MLLIAEGSLPWQAGGVPWGLGGRLPLAAVVGVGIGLVSSLLGVAGGELIIPTFVFLFGADIKLAGTASVLVSLPTVLVGLARYARLGAFEERSDLATLVLPMGVGSILGAFLGGILVPTCLPERSRSGWGPSSSGRRSGSSEHDRMGSNAQPWHRECSPGICSGARFSSTPRSPARPPLSQE